FGDLMLLDRVYLILRRRIIGDARLDLHKYQHLPIARDNINLPQRRLVIAKNDFVPQPLQMSGRKILAAPAQRSPLAAAENLCQPSLHAPTATTRVVDRIPPSAAACGRRCPSQKGLVDPTTQTRPPPRREACLRESPRP